MIIFLTIVHVLVCLFLIVVVLLQSGKAADLAGAFGGMGSQTAFGPRGAATLLSKATTIAAAVFMVTSLSLSIWATRSGGGAATVLDSRPAPKKGAAPAEGAKPTMTIEMPGGGTKTIELPLPPKPGEEQKGGTKLNVTIPGQATEKKADPAGTPQQIPSTVPSQPLPPAQKK
ncbi:MAG: preprotein translocase subunit SecG [Bryobacteraceae bacterium]